jgi:hypothetical protein
MMRKITQSRLKLLIVKDGGWKIRRKRENRLKQVRKVIVMKPVLA